MSGSHRVVEGLVCAKRLSAESPKEGRFNGTSLDSA